MSNSLVAVRRLKTGAQLVAYQSRPAARTTNLLFLADSRGLPLACASPQASNHHDLFDIETLFGELCVLLEEVQLSLKEVSLSVDRGLDAQNLRTVFFGAASKRTSR